MPGMVMVLKWIALHGWRDPVVLVDTGGVLGGPASRSASAVVKVVSMPRAPQARGTVPGVLSGGALRSPTRSVLKMQTC